MTAGEVERSDPHAPRDSHGQPISCARRWVANPVELNGGHWSPECPNLVETNPTDMRGERYRCSVCGYSYYLDYEDMK
jgi:hypothetical protein